MLCAASEPWWILAPPGRREYKARDISDLIRRLGRSIYHRAMARPIPLHRGSAVRRCQHSNAIFQQREFHRTIPNQLAIKLNRHILITGDS